MKMCPHRVKAAAAMQVALAQGQYPALHHFAIGWASMMQPKGRRTLRDFIGMGIVYRAICVLAVLFVIRAWNYDQPYWVALLGTALFMIGWLVLACIFAGWMIDLTDSFETDCDCSL